VENPRYNHVIAVVPRKIQKICLVGLVMLPSTNSRLFLALIRVVTIDMFKK